MLPFASTGPVMVIELVVVKFCPGRRVYVAGFAAVAVERSDICDQKVIFAMLPPMSALAAVIASRSEQELLPLVLSTAPAMQFEAVLL